MRRFARENAFCALLALAGCATIGWLGLYGYAWNDYDTEARAALQALTHGDIHGFLALAPAYGGSLVERAPFALIPGLWGGGGLALYRMVTLPCLLASAVLAVWLVDGMRREGHRTLARGVALAVCVVNPITLRALEVGHPEELLGGCMCVAAVLLASRGRPVWAGVLLGLAVANKEWALLAAGPVLLAAAPGARRACAAAAVLLAAAILLPLTLFSGAFASTSRALASPAGNAIFQPWQLWWFLGSHGAPVHGLYGAVKPGYRTPPSWASTLSHPVILAAAVAVALALWTVTRRRGERRAGERDALLALALLLLLRCILDTWDAIYYALPFVLALLAWEVTGPPDRPPVLALLASVLVWFSFQWLPAHAGADTQALAYLLWSVPLAVWMAARLLAGPRALARRSPAQEMTVSSRGRLVSTS